MVPGEQRSPVIWRLADALKQIDDRENDEDNDQDIKK